MTAKELLQILDQQQLISRNVARQLHAKVDQGGGRITAESVLKFLVKKELISRQEAKRLLNSQMRVSPKAQSSIMGDAVLPSRPEKKDGPPTKTPPSLEDDSLGLAPIEEDDDTRSPEASRSRKPPKIDDSPEIVEVVPVEPAVAKQPRKPQGEAPNSLSEGETTVADGMAGKESALVDSSLDEAAARSGAYVGKRKKGKKKKDRRKNEWDSPLLLLGGGGLLVLALTGVLLYYFLFRENADQKLKASADLFAGGSYNQAVTSYEEFVEDFPNHPEISSARVRLEMARLFAAVNGSSSVDPLETAKEVIKAIEDEPAFVADGESEDGLSTAKRELSELLTSIVVKLSEQADEAEDPAVAAARIGATREAVALTNNTKYVPRRLRLDDQISNSLERLDLVERRLARDSTLAATLENMDQAIAEKAMVRAFELRRQLLLEHPMLESDASLAAKVKEVSESQRLNIQFTPASRAALTDPSDTNVNGSVAFAQRSGAAAPGVEGYFSVRIDGVLYGFAAGDGELLWRRHVGPAPAAYPLALPGGKLVVSDVATSELICLNEEDGSLLWRQPLSGVVSQPVLLGNRLLATSDAGELFVVDAATGALAGSVQIGQPILLPPVVSDDGKRVYVVGNEANLYTLSADDLSCLGVFYLGHFEGSISAPPSFLLGQLIVAVNVGSETCRVDSISIDDDGVLELVASSSRLNGLVNTPMAIRGRRVAVSSTQGAVHVYEAGLQEGRPTVNLLASRDGRHGEQVAHFGYISEGERESSLWIAGRGLTRLAILPTGNRMPVRSIEQDYGNDVFDYPIQSIGDLIILVRRPDGQAGLAVASMDARTNQTVWETTFAAPAAGPPAVESDGQDVSVLTSVGVAYSVERVDPSPRVISEKYEKNEATRLNLVVNAQLADGALAAGAVGSTELVLIRPPGAEESGQTLTRIALPGSLACPLIAWRDGVVAPTVVGQVGYYDADGQSAATPFQPSIVPGQRFDWLRPAVFNESKNSTLAISDRTRLFLLQVQQGTRTFLAATAEANVADSSLSTQLAIVADQLFAGTEDGRLARFSLPELTAAAPIDVGGPIAWGPFAERDGVLFETADGQLTLVDQSGTIRWAQAHEFGTPSGEPLFVEGSAFVLFPRQGVTRISLTDGTASRIDVGEPAVLGPTPLDEQLLLTALDGTLLAVKRP